MKRRLQKLLSLAGNLAIYESGRENIETIRQAIVNVAGRDNIETGKRAGRRFIAEMKNVEKNYEQMKKQVEQEIKTLSKK